MMLTLANMICGVTTMTLPKQTLPKQINKQIMTKRTIDHRRLRPVHHRQVPAAVDLGLSLTHVLVQSQTHNINRDPLAETITTIVNRNQLAHQVAIADDVQVRELVETVDRIVHQEQNREADRHTEAVDIVVVDVVVRISFSIHFTFAFISH